MLGKKQRRAMCLLVTWSSNDRPPSCLTTTAPIHCNQTEHSIVIDTDILYLIILLVVDNNLVLSMNIYIYIYIYIYIQGDSGGICTTLGNHSMSDYKQKSS